MRIKSQFRFGIYLLLVSLLCSCGGGSSGGDSSANARDGVRVLHASIELSPVELYSSLSEEGLPLQRAHFMQDVFFAAASGQEQTISVTTVKRPGDVLFTIPVEQDQLGRLSVLIYGDRSTFGLRKTPFFEPEIEIPDGKTALRLVHGATRALEIEGNFNGDSIDLVPFGGVSDYIYIEPGDIEYLIRRKVDRRVIASGLSNLEVGRAYTFLVGGEVEYFVSVTSYLDRP